MFQHKKHLFFDLDHTLWDFEKNSALAYERIFEERKLPLHLPKFLEVYIPTNLKYWKLYREEKISQEDLRFHRLKEVFDALNFTSITKNEVMEIAHDYIAYLPTYNYLYEGAMEILEYLQPNYHLHIITNGFAEVQHRKIQQSGLEHYFKTVTNSETAGVKKPNPQIFQTALQLAQANLSESIMIGDSLEADIEGAQNFGLDTIYFNEFQIPHQNPTPQVFHLLELKEWF
ncbi:MAG: YjjG family noncanonical pyrimidine nucleotidase [Flavobacterium sp.]